MRRLHAAAPIPLLLTGCAWRPWTPSVSVAYWAEEPRAIDRVLPAAETEIARWSLPIDNPWHRFSKSTLLAALGSPADGLASATLPDVLGLEVVARAQRAASSVAARGLSPDTLWVVDLRGAASVAFGATLSQRAREPVAVVLTFNNWPAENELVPAEETLAALLAFSPRLPDAAYLPSTPVLLLDAWRLAYRFEETSGDLTDNRYLLGPADLPDVETLRQQGVRQIVYVVQSRDDTTVEEDDLNATFAAYQAAGLPIVLADLDDLQRCSGAEQLVVQRRLTVAPRQTVVDNVEFYRRARGGFGGVRAGPSILRVGGGFHVGHGGG